MIPRCILFGLLAASTAMAASVPPEYLSVSNEIAAAGVTTVTPAPSNTGSTTTPTLSVVTATYTEENVDGTEERELVTPTAVVDVDEDDTPPSIRRARIINTVILAIVFTFLGVVVLYVLFAFFQRLRGKSGKKLQEERQAATANSRMANDRYTVNTVNYTAPARPKQTFDRTATWKA